MCLPVYVFVLFSTAETYVHKVLAKIPRGLAASSTPLSMRTEFFSTGNRTKLKSSFADSSYDC